MYICAGTILLQGRTTLGAELQTALAQYGDDPAMQAARDNSLKIVQSLTSGAHSAFLSLQSFVVAVDVCCLSVRCLHPGRMHPGRMRVQPYALACAENHCKSGVLCMYPN